MSQSQIPLWLDIKTEYIDENFEKVLDYLHKGTVAKETQDSFYSKTLELLSKRVDILYKENASRPVKDNGNREDNKDKNIFCVRLIAAYLLSNRELEEYDKRKAYYTLLFHLSVIVPVDYSQQLIELAVRLLTGTIKSNVPFGWSDILDLSPQILAHKLINQTEAQDPDNTRLAFRKKGTAEIADGILSLKSASDEKKNQSLVQSLGIFDDRIQVLAPKGEKVKKSELDNIEKIEAFTRGFILDQQKVLTVKPKKVLKEYETGDVFEARITGFRENEIFIRSIEPEYAVIESSFSIEKGLLFYGIVDFIRHLKVGDILLVELTNSETGQCSIQNEFVKYVVEELARADKGKEVLAECIDIHTDKNKITKMVWMTDMGYPAYSTFVEEADKGTFAYIEIESFGKDNYYGFINANYVETTTDSFDSESVRRKCIEGFCLPEPEEKDTEPEEISAASIKILCDMLVSYQQNLTKPSQRYTILCIARIISELLGNPDDSDYIGFLSDYLEALVLFANGDIDKIMELQEGNTTFSPSEKRKRDIIRILREYGSDSENEFLSNIIEESDDELLRKIAVLVQSCNRIDDVISKSMKNVIKREIIKCLSIETEGESDLEEENGTYLGIESNRQEFKTSFFIAPANAREQNQKLNIFKGMCAFLNSQVGGTLYLGVNDLGYVKGISSDIEYMEKNCYGSYHGIDGYIRYITDEAKKYFELGMLTHVEMNAMYDGQVVAISVIPYEYKIVTLEGVAYIRLNSESVVMTEDLKRQIMSSRALSQKGKEANIHALQEAIRDKRKVIFHDYRSSSGTIETRNMEPFAFQSGFSYIWCYDLDKSKVSFFKTIRIKNVEVTEDRWEFEAQHKQGNKDAFHMTGDKPIHCVLEMNLMASNLLTEEYPEAASSLAPTDDDDRWILDINVYKIEGIGRFYIGLAENIRIIDAPELKEYAVKYAAEYLN